MAKRSADLGAFVVPKIPPALPEEIGGEAGERRPRAGRTLEKKNLQMTPEAIRELAILKAETGRQERELLSEALNLLFKKHGKPQVA